MGGVLILYIRTEFQVTVVFTSGTEFDTIYRLLCGRYISILRYNKSCFMGNFGVRAKSDV